MEFLKTMINVEEGKQVLGIEKGSSINIDTDSVILATGQRADTQWVSGQTGESIMAGQSGLSIVNEFDTPHPKVFVAGDFATGATTLIDAIAHGRKAALRVTRFLTGASSPTKKIKIERKKFATDFEGGQFPRTQEMNVIPIQPVPVINATDRIDGAEVELGYDQTSTDQAGKRCYLCHYKFEIDNRLCVLCDECVKVKPTDDCILPISDLSLDDDGSVVRYKQLCKGESDSLYYNQLWINQDKCIRCGQCEAVCPVGAISIQKVSFLKV